MKTTYFSKLHPVTKLIYYSFLAVITMTVMNPGILAMIVTGLLCYMKLFSNLVTGKRFLSLCGLFSLVVAINMITNPRGTQILFYILDRPFTYESFIWGVTMALSIVNLLLIFIGGGINVSTLDFLYVFSPILPKISLLISMSISFCGKFVRTVGDLSVILKTKGVNMGQGSLRKRLGDGATILATLISYSLEESLTTADSMKARGYGVCKRTNYRFHWVKRMDKIYGLLSILSAIFVLVMYFEEIRRMGGIIGTPTFGVSENLFLLSYMLTGLLVALPFIEEGRFVLKWKFLKQKI